MRNLSRGQCFKGTFALPLSLRATRVVGKHKSGVCFDAAAPLK